MRPAVRFCVIGFLGLTAYFVIGSLTSNSMSFPYGYVSAGALLLFFLLGLYASRWESVGSTAIVCGVVALSSSLAAWLILGLFNPLRQSEPSPQADAILEVVVLIAVAAMGVGGIGAMVGRRLRPSETEVAGDR